MFEITRGSYKGNESKLQEKKDGCVHTCLAWGCWQRFERVRALVEATAQALLAANIDDPTHRLRTLVGWAESWLYCSQIVLRFPHF